MFVRLLLLAFVAATVTVAQNEEGQYAVDMVTSHNTHLQYPWFSSLKTIDPQLKRCITEDLGKVMSILAEYVDKQLNHPVNYMKSFGRGAMVVKQILDARSKNKELRHELVGQIVEAEGNFNKKVQQMFSRMMKRSGQISKELESSPDRVMSNEVLLARIKGMMDDILEAVKNGPTATYVDWDNATVNGAKFADIASELFGQLKHKGVGSILTVLEKLTNIIATFST